MPHTIIKKTGLTQEQFERTKAIEAQHNQAGEAPSLKDETPAGDISGGGSAVPGGLGNFSFALKTALNEAARSRSADRFKQIYPELGGVPGTMGDIARMIRGSVAPPVESVFTETLKVFEARRKEMEFNPSQFRNQQGGIYDLKNNFWVINPKPDRGERGEITIDLGGGKSTQILPNTRQVIDGFTSLDELTPSLRQNVRTDLFALGFREEKFPFWYRDELEQQNLQTLLPDVIQSEWNEKRNTVLFGKNRYTVAFLRDLYDEKDLKKLAKKAKQNVEQYLESLVLDIESWKEFGFTDEQINDKLRRG